VHLIGFTIEMDTSNMA